MDSFPSRKRAVVKDNLIVARVSSATAGWLACAPSFAAEPTRFDAFRGMLPAHAGWTLLAGIGLVAVAVAAWSAKRPRRGVPAGEVPFGDAPPLDDPAVPEIPDATQPSNDAASIPAARTSVTMPTTVIVELVDTPEHREIEAPARPAQADAPANGSQLFLALHHVDLSIDVLHRHLQRDPRPMPAVWLMLLDLCRTHGREQMFGGIALEFHRRFNVQRPAWAAFPPNRDDPGLEAHPRLVTEITQTWGTHECRRLLDRLLYDNRGGNRRGFTLNAYNDLIALRRAAEAVVTTIEQDLEEEAKVRSAFASAAAEAFESPSAADRPQASPHVQDLEAQLQGDLAAGIAPQSAIEREHPALARMLAREWGNAEMSARLCEMLARGGDGTHLLSKEAAEELALLRRLAERLHAANGIEFPGEVAA